MDIAELKNKISQATGIPATLLIGGTEREVFDYAKKLAAFRAENGEAGSLPAEQPSGGGKTRDQFADWVEGQLHGVSANAKNQSAGIMDQINKLEKELYPGYPNLYDPGSSGIDPGDPRTPRDKFSEWFGEAFAYNPLL